MAENVRGSTLFTRGSEPFYDLFCQPCSEDKRHLEAHGFCQDCQEYICQDCYDNHRKPRPMRHHYLLDKDEMPKTPPLSTFRSAPDVCTKNCKNHPKEIIKYHCPKHDDVVCGVCVTLSHITCGVKYIPDLASGIGESDEYKKLNQALLNFAKKAQESIDLAKKNLTNAQQSYDDTLKEVQQVRTEMNEMMDLLESKIRAEADVLKSADNKRMNAMIGNCENLLREAKGLQSRLKAMKDKNLEYNLFLDMKKSREDLRMIKGKINELQENNHVKHYVFDRSDDLWDFVNNTSAYGKLMQKGRSKQDSNTTKLDHVTDISLSLTKKREEKAPLLTGMVLLNEDTLAAVDDHNGNMHVFDIHRYAHKHVAKLPGHPWDITRVGKKYVAVTIQRLQRVICFIVSDGVEIERDFPTNGRCYGIEYQKECFYVTFLGSNACIEILDKSGKTLTKIDRLGNTIIDYPNYISISCDSLIVPEYDHGTVNQIQKSGELEWIYNAPDLQSPLGLAVGRNGSIIVCAEKSDNIHILSPDGKRGRVLLSLKGPQAVAFCKSSGRLFVTQDPFDKLKVYQMY